MQVLRFDPATLEIPTGTTVVWVNDELFDYAAADGTHRVVADDGSFDSGELQPKQRFAMGFLEAATIAYHCAIHPALMTGEVRVSGPTVAPEPTRRDVAIVEPEQTDPDSWGFKPADIGVDAGTTVRWRNTGAQQHTVTADDGTFDSGLLEPGATFEWTFDDAVSLRYHCEPHPWMEGIVRVAGAAPPPPRPRAERATTPRGASAFAQPAREGDGPATFSIVAQEPSASDPQGWGFAPSSLRVRAGDTVVWRNGGSQVHTVTADDGAFDSGNLSPGETFKRTFDQPATFRFHCTPHPWMKGVVLVTEATAPRDAPAPAIPIPDEPSIERATPPAASGADDAADTSPRTPLAVATLVALALLGAALVLPSARPRRPRFEPIEPDEIPEPVGAAR